MKTYFYWNVPPGILEKEVLPGNKKNPNYLANHKMEWNNGAVRQLTRPHNWLGCVKFLFRNSYNIYLRDTPAKDLFNDPKAPPVMVVSVLLYPKNWQNIFCAKKVYGQQNELPRQ